MTLITNLRLAVARHAQYRATLRELRAIPDYLAEDVGIYPGEARMTARRAVYG